MRCITCTDDLVDTVGFGVSLPRSESFELGMSESRRRNLVVHDTARRWKSEIRTKQYGLQSKKVQYTG
jgi:hypothetical protein